LVNPTAAALTAVLAAKEQVPKMQMDLFGKQISNEMTSSRNCEVLLCDRSLFDILMYTRIFFENNDEADMYVKSMTHFCEYYSKSYDHVFLTSTCFSPKIVKDEIRPKDEKLQKKAHNELRKILDEFFVEYSILGSSPENEIFNWIINKI